MATKCHARSISLPSSRSHPTTLKVEEKLKKINTFHPSSSSSSSSVCGALSGVQDLYDSVDDLLKMGSTQKLLSCPQHKQLVEELLDGSMKLLDVCSLAKDMASQTQQHVRALRSVVRRTKGDYSAVKTAIVSYTCYRKRMMKEANKLITSMKKMNQKSNSSLRENPDHHHHLSSVIGVLRRAFSTNSSIFEIVLLYMTALTKSKAPRGLSMVSKWVHKAAIACESNDGLNEFEKADEALNSVFEVMKVEKLEIAERKLESLEMAAEEMESGLEGVFRRLIKTRASLLNIISQ